MPAIGLLLFEVSRVFEKQPDPSVTLVPNFGRKVSVGNLNRSDPRTRAVHGGRERKCCSVCYLCRFFITNFDPFGRSAKCGEKERGIRFGKFENFNVVLS